MAGQRSLPTLDKLQSEVPADVNVKEVAMQWLESFAQHVRSVDIDGIIDLFVEDAFFRESNPFEVEEFDFPLNGLPR